ncbi:hypothetical protein COF09_32580, partial [Bacillus toyonensis]
DLWTERIRFKAWMAYTTPSFAPPDGVPHLRGGQFPKEQGPKGRKLKGPPLGARRDRPHICGEREVSCHVTAQSSPQCAVAGHGRHLDGG